MYTSLLTRPVGELVAERPSRSRVFQKYGIDFCCGGKRSLTDVCHEQGLDAASVAEELASDNKESNAQEKPADTMSLIELCNHIEAAHHGYLKSELPRLGAMAERVATVHGAQHPWTVSLSNVFSHFTAEMQSHLMKEELVLFPNIRSLELGSANSSHSIAQPINVMEHEHDNAGEALKAMRGLSGGFSPPAEACNTFRALLHGLAELEADTHLHVHLENNVLFPRALQLEATRMSGH